MTAAGARGARFGRMQVEMLECAYQHRLLSTAQLHALYRDGLSLRRTQRALAAMEQVSWLASVREPGGMKLWFVTERGAAAVESIGGRAELRRKVIPPEHAAGPSQQHTLAVNEVGVAFVRAARERGDEFGPLAWRNEIAHPIGRAPGGGRSEVVIADAVLSYDRYEPGPEVFSHWASVELDRATMTVEALVAKLGRYLRLLDYAGPLDKRRVGSTPLWRERYPRFPAVLLVLANGSRRRLLNRQWLVQSVWREHEERGRRIRLHVCLLEHLIEQGPFAPIFLSNRHEANQLVDWRGRPPDEPEEDPQPAECDELEPPDEPEPVGEPEPEPPAPADQWGRW